MAAEHPPRHPVVACARAIRAMVAEVVDVPVMDPRDKAEGLVELARAKAQLEAKELDLLAHSADVAEQRGACDAGTWLAHATHIDSRTARADLLLAIALDEKYQAVAAGMRDGAVN